MIRALVRFMILAFALNLQAHAEPINAGVRYGDCVMSAGIDWRTQSPDRGIYNRRCLMDKIRATFTGHSYSAGHVGIVLGRGEPSKGLKNWIQSPTGSGILATAIGMAMQEYQESRNLLQSFSSVVPNLKRNFDESMARKDAEIGERTDRTPELQRQLNDRREDSNGFFRTEAARVPPLPNRIPTPLPAPAQNVLNTVQTGAGRSTAANRLPQSPSYRQRDGGNPSSSADLRSDLEAELRLPRAADDEAVGKAIDEYLKRFEETGDPRAKKLAGELLRKLGERRHGSEQTGQAFEDAKTFVNKQITLGLKANELAARVRSGDELSVPRESAEGILKATDIFAQNAEDSFYSGDTGAGQGWQGLALGAVDIGLGMIPVVGNVKDGLEAVLGRSLITGEELTPFERGLAFAGATTLFPLKSITKAMPGLLKAAKVFGQSDPNSVGKVVEAGKRAMEYAPKITIGEILDAEKLNQAEYLKRLARNEEHIRNGRPDLVRKFIPPWKWGKSVLEVTTTGPLKLYRVYGGGAPLAGGWLMDVDPRTLSKVELQQMFSLPDANGLDFVGEVILPAGTNLQVGIVAEKLTGGLTRGGGTQWLLKNVTDYEKYFKDLGGL